MRIAIKKINYYSQFIAAFTLGILLFMTVVDVFLRNAFFIYMRGTYEITQMLMSIIVFMAVGYSHDKKEHVVIDIVYEHLSHVKKWVLSLVSSLFFLAITSTMTWVVFQFALRQMDKGDHTSSLQIPMWPMAMLGAFGMFMFSLSVIGDMIFIIKDRGVLTLDAG